MNRPLMPKATALWLMNKTSLTIEQIAKFCALHAFEILGLKNASNLQPLSPLVNGQLTREEIARCEKDPTSLLMLNPLPLVAKGKTRRYTPVSKRSEIPHCILWMIQTYPKITDAQVASLLSTTSSMVKTIRSGAHWNMKALTPKDPVILGLCSALALQPYESAL